MTRNWQPKELLALALCKLVAAAQNEAVGAKPDRTAAALRTRNRNRYCYTSPAFLARPEA
jgi:hypothetical protein